MLVSFHGPLAALLTSFTTLSAGAEATVTSAEALPVTFWVVLTAAVLVKSAVTLATEQE